jgi:hypothetical protein
MDVLVNSGAKSIDIEKKEIYNDRRWKGFWPIDSHIPAWIFQNGFNKTFSLDDGTVKGVTSTFDDHIRGQNTLRLIDDKDPGKGILLQYTNLAYRLFYDELKVIDQDTVVGKAFMGKFPHGEVLMKFSMSRRYSFDYMTNEDHEELFEKYGKPPELSEVLGKWEGRMVSNASLSPPLFKFNYVQESSGKVVCKYDFMHMLKGNSRVELTPDQMLMFDFTNFHDEIRMITGDVMVGKYCPKGKLFFDFVGNTSVGLVHFEKTPAGERPAVYYYIQRST